MMLFLFIGCLYLAMWNIISSTKRLICMLLAVVGFVANALVPLFRVGWGLSWFPQYMGAIGIPLVILFIIQLLQRRWAARHPEEAATGPAQKVQADVVGGQSGLVVEGEFMGRP